MADVEWGANYPTETEAISFITGATSKEVKEVGLSQTDFGKLFKAPLSRITHLSMSSLDTFYILFLYQEQAGVLFLVYRSFFM